MKKIILAAALAAWCAGATAWAALESTSNYSAQGGALWGVGGMLEVLSGGTLKLDSGSNLTINNAAAFATLGATTLQAGSSGAAGTVTIYPSTGSKGHAILSISDQTGNTNVTQNFAAMGQATVLTVPDPGSTTASYVLTKGAQTVSGALTLSGANTQSGTFALSGATTLTGQLTANSAVVPTSFTVTHAAGATNSIDVTITAKDSSGATLAAVTDVEVFVAGDSACAAGLTSQSASGNLTASTGAILTALTAKKHVIATTNASGVLVLNLVDSAKPATQYFCVKTWGGRVVPSTASGTDWGA